MGNWQWQNGELVKTPANCRVAKTYPACEDKPTVCDPVATSFGDECGVENCKKVS